MPFDDSIDTYVPKLKFKDDVCEIWGKVEECVSKVKFLRSVKGEDGNDKTLKYAPQRKPASIWLLTYELFK